MSHPYTKVVVVQIEFEPRLYEELKQSLKHFSTVPIIDRQSHKFMVNPDTKQPMMIVDSTKVSEFLKIGATTATHAPPPP